MRDDYKLKGSTAKLQVELEKSVIDVIQSMEKYTQLSASQLTNVALKRFIAAHKDFLPPQKAKDASKR